MIVEDISKTRCLSTKSLGPSGAPVRFWRKAQEGEEYGDTILEVFPQNCWSHITKENMQIPGWNDIHNDFDKFENRTKEGYALDTNWLGIKTREDYDRLLRVGDTSNTVQLTGELGQSIANLSRLDKKRRKKWINNEDGEIMFDAYMCRDPEIFYAKRRVEGKKFRTNLVIATGGNCGVSAATLKIRAQINAAIVDELQRQGHNVGLHALDPISVDSGEHLACLMWEIKKHDEQMSLPALQRDLGHPAVYRTAVFDMIASLPQDPGYGLGSTAASLFASKTEHHLHHRAHISNMLKQHFGEPIIVLNLFDLNENLDEKKALNLLPAITKHLNNLVTKPHTTGVHFINHTSND